MALHLSSCSASSSDGDSGADHDAASADVSTTLYFGNLHPYVQQRSLEDLCGYFGAVDSAKVIKDKGTGTSAGYGFVRFVDKSAAEAALQALNGQRYLGEELRVNWALPNNHKEDTSHHHHVFVGDLSSDVTDAVLYNTFCTVGQCSDARVMWDHTTGRSKGYGFISFRRKEDAEAAIDKMQGKQIGSRRIRVGWAQHKQDESVAPPDFGAIDRADPLNTNVYIGNIAPETSEADLHAYFTAYGPLAEVKLHKKGGYGFVKYEAHESAVKAIVGQHGKDLHRRVLKCSWGKNIASTRNSSSASASTALSLAAALQQVSMGAAKPLMLMPGGAQTTMASLAAAAATVPRGGQLPGSCYGVFPQHSSAGAGGFHHHQHSSSGCFPQHVSGGMPMCMPLGQLPPGLMGLPNDASAAQALAGNPQSLLAMMYNQAAMSQQAMSPVNLAAQIMMMQQQQDGGLNLHATMAALAMHPSAALTAGNMALDPPGMYGQQDGGMYGAGAGGPMYGFPGATALMLQ